MQRDCTIHVAKTYALISFAVTAKLICVFVFAYTKSRFSRDAAQFVLGSLIVPRYESLSSGFPTESVTNRAVQT